MSFVGKETEDAPDLRRQNDELLTRVLNELTLLNLRFEEAFNTNIHPEDIPHED